MRPRVARVGDQSADPPPFYGHVLARGRARRRCWSGSVNLSAAEQSLAAADHSAFSAMEQHKPELNRKSRVDRCLQLCFISNSKLSWGGDIGNDDQNRAFEQAGFG